MSTLVGQLAQSTANVAPAFLGGGGPSSYGYLSSLSPGTTGLFNPGGYLGGPNLDPVSAAMASSGDPSTSTYFSGGTPTAPGAPIDPTSLAVPAATAMGPTGGVGFSPAGATEAAFANLPSTTDPLSNTPLAGTFGPTFPSLGTGAAGGAGAGGTTDPKGMGVPGWVSLAGGLFSDVNRYLLQRQLQNPQALAAAASQIAKAQNAKVRAQLVAPTTAAMEESSGVNAPMIYGQAITNALAPGLWEAQQNALQEELAALGQSANVMGGYGGGGSPLSSLLSMGSL